METTACWRPTTDESFEFVGRVFNGTPLWKCVRPQVWLRLQHTNHSKCQTEEKYGGQWSIVGRLLKLFSYHLDRRIDDLHRLVSQILSEH